MILRMLLAALAGFIVAAVGAAAGSEVGVALVPQSPGGLPTTAYLAIAVAAGFLGAIAGGYVCARLAPAGRLLATMAVLVAILFAVAVVTARVYGVARQPQGYLPAVTMLDLIGLWAGAMIERAVRGGTAQ